VSSISRWLGGVTIAALALTACSSEGDGSSGPASGGSTGIGGSSTGGQDGGVVGTGGEGTTDGPPPECYAPCLWALVADCRPAGACTSEDRGDLRILCDSASSWRYENDTFISTTTVLGRDGSLCYVVENTNSMPTYLDADGNVVVTLDLGTRVDGRYLATCADGTQYYSDHNAPECLAWAMVTCTEGVCP
jgi:hypothetical protein